MSLSDELRYLRALHGGAEPYELEQATGVPHYVYSFMEKKYARVGDDDVLGKVAEFYQVPVEKLLAERERYRKRLTQFLADVTAQRRPIRLRLRGDAVAAGTVERSDRLIVSLRQPDGSEVVAYRHNVVDWEEA
jgi:hypothetical protein